MRRFDATRPLRWVQRFTPEFIEAARPRRHAPGDRWFADETYLEIAGTWTLWVPTMSSLHATCEYSWIRPPSRSHRRTRMLSSAGAVGILPSGGLWLRVRCGRWVL